MLAKTRRSYTVGEAANLLDVHKNTVRSWIKNGLQTCDDKRPLLIIGGDLRDFLIQKRKKNKRKCPPGTIYCVSCKSPQKPVNGAVTYKAITDTKGLLIGTCPHCSHRINRITTLLKINQINLEFKVTMTTHKKGLSNSN